MRKIIQQYLAEIDQVPETFRLDYFNSLDGFRAVSIFIVIIGHLNLRWGNAILAQLLENGHLGVYIFFVISGFLITALLLKEKISTGTVSLKRFYLRRFLRIVPAAYLYLAAIGLLNYFYGLEISLVAILAGALFVRNFTFMGEGNWFVNHYWSLSVEEQFYLIFPSILKWNLKRYKVLILLFIITVIFVRFMLVAKWLTGNTIIYLMDFFDKGLDGILIGSLFAILVYQGMIPWRFFHRFRPWINVMLVLLIPAVCNNNFNNYVFYAIPSLLVNTVLYALVGLLIINNITYSTGLIFRFLNSRIMIGIGLISYSLYIWQQLFMVSETFSPGSSRLPWYDFPVNIILLIMISVFSYRFYETPLRKLRKRFEQRQNFAKV